MLFFLFLLLFFLQGIREKACKSSLSLLYSSIKYRSCLLQHTHTYMLTKGGDNNRHSYLIRFLCIFIWGRGRDEHTLRNAHRGVIILCKVFSKIKPFMFMEEEICNFPMKWEVNKKTQFKKRDNDNKSILWQWGSFLSN